MDREDPHLGTPIGIEVALDLPAACLEPPQETLQRGRFAALILEGARQQFVDRIGRLVSQPLEQPLASAFGTQGLREEIERRDEVGACQPHRQPAVRPGEGRLARLFTQGPPQVTGAFPGQRKELVFVEADQRRLEQAGEVEVVLRQQDEARHRQQVLDRELFPEIEPVDARDLDLLALQLAHQRVDEGIAPSHQHHQVSLVQQLAGTRAALPADEALGMHRDLSRESLVRRPRPLTRRADCGGVEVGFLGGDQRPELDPARRLLAAGIVCDRGSTLRDTARRVGVAEYPVNGVEHGRRRAEGYRQVDGLESLGSIAAPLLEPLAHLGELAWVGALEAEDRLLGVAHGEDRAIAVDRAGACEEFLGQAADHLPLVGVGVLCLVNQHVVDPAVELVEHPRGGVGVFQQSARGDNQVVIVESSLPSLGPVVTPRDVEA